MKMTAKLQKIRPLTTVGILLLLTGFWVETSVPANAETSFPSGRTVLNFNREWRFAKDDVTGAETSDFDDLAWEVVRLPHDWAIAGPFDPAENGYAGKLPWKGMGWYRKTFTLKGLRDGQRVYFDFDGVMAFPKI